MVFSFSGLDFDAVFGCPVWFGGIPLKCPLVCHTLGLRWWCGTDACGWWLARCAGGNLACSD